MSRTLLFFACVFVARAADLMSGSSELKNGLTVRYRTVLEPPLRQSQILMVYGGHAVSGNRVHRTLSEKNSDAYYGYDLVADPDGPRRIRVSIEPLSRLPGGRLLPLPKYPAPQVIEEGDIIALDLLVSRDGAQKLVDYIEVLRTPEPGPASTSRAPRDFTLDDGPASLHFSGPMRLYRNGAKVQDGLAHTVRQGATMWFAIPGEGRYILSLEPHEGFQKAGAIRDHTLSFQADSGVYELRTGAPILGARKAWNLYVHHDPGYKSDVRVSPPIHAGVDRLENLLSGDDPLQEMFHRIRKPQ